MGTESGLQAHSSPAAHRTRSSGWTPGAAFTSVWYRSGKKTGITGPTYLLTRADKGKKITVNVTGSTSSRPGPDGVAARPVGHARGDAG